MADRKITNVNNLHFTAASKREDCQPDRPTDTARRDVPRWCRTTSSSPPRRRRADLHILHRFSSSPYSYHWETIKRAKVRCPAFTSIHGRRRCPLRRGRRVEPSRPSKRPRLFELGSFVRRGISVIPRSHARRTHRFCRRHDRVTCQ